MCTLFYIPDTWHSSSPILGTQKYLLEKWGLKSSLFIETILYDTIMVNTCHYPSVKIHRIYITKSEPQCGLWTLDDNEMSDVGSFVTNGPVWWGMLMVGKAVHM